jgi:DNA modification methylase
MKLESSILSNKPFIKVYTGDCMKLMLEIGGAYDMIFLDPPYFEWENEQPEFKAAAVKPDHNRLSALTSQLLKPNGVVFLCGTLPQLLNDWHYWSRFFKFCFEIIEYKNMGTPLINIYRPIPMHENIWCMCRKDCRISDTKLNMRRAAKGAGTVVSKESSGGMSIRYGENFTEWRVGMMYPKSVMQVKRIDKSSKEYEGHPTQKPLSLMKTVIKMSTDEGDWILDPFAGSGTTLFAARELNRNCIGIEIQEEYVRLIKRRFERAEQLAKLSRDLRGWTG